MEKAEKPVSKFIAILLSIVNSLLLIPGVMGILLYSAVLFGGKSWSYVYSRFFELLTKSGGISYLFARSVPYLVFFIGCALLAGYILHALSKLKTKLQPALWIATFIYNLPLPLFAVYLLATASFSEKGVSGASFSGLLYPALIIIWMTLTCVLSCMALRADFLSKVENKMEVLK